MLHRTVSSRLTRPSANLLLRLFWLYFRTWEGPMLGLMIVIKCGSLSWIREAVLAVICLKISVKCALVLSASLSVLLLRPSFPCVIAHCAGEPLEARDDLSRVSNEEFPDQSREGRHYRVRVNLMTFLRARARQPLNLLASSKFV